MCIGDAGAQALSTCFGQQEDGATDTSRPPRSSFDLGGAEPIFRALLFLISLWGVCRALKNHIGSSGVVACSVYDVSHTIHDITSVAWMMPWRILLCRVYTRTIPPTLHFVILERLIPGFEQTWRNVCFLCTTGILVYHGIDVDTGLLFFEHVGRCAGALLLCALLRLLCAPLCAPWNRLRAPLHFSPFRCVVAPICNAGLHLPIEPLARVASPCGPTGMHNLQNHRRAQSSTPWQQPQPRDGRVSRQSPFVTRCIWFVLGPCLGLTHSLPVACGLGPVWAGHIAVWVFASQPAEASVTPAGFASLSSFDPDTLPEPPESQDGDGPEESPSHLELAEGEWTSGLSPAGALQLPPYLQVWPSRPVSPRPASSPPAHRRLVRLPLPRPSSPDFSEDEWLGIIVHAPYYQPRCWGINLRHVQDVDDIMDVLLRQGSELFDEGFDAIVPITPPRHDVFANFIVYPRCLGHVGGCKYIAAMVDATCVGGRYFATVLPQTLSRRAFVAYIQSQITYEPDQLLVYFGRHDGPASDQEPMHLEDGDAITVLAQTGRPPTPFDVRTLLERNAPRGKLEHVPMHEYAPGYCLIRGSERWYLHQRYHHSRTPAQAAALYLDRELTELTLRSSDEFPDLDMMGEPCIAILAATNLPPGPNAGGDALERLDVFTFLDFRPIGFKPQVHFSHSFQLHVPTLLSLYSICISPDFGLSIEGGVVHRDFVIVPQVATLRFSDRRRHRHPSPFDPGDDTAPASAQPPAPTAASPGDSGSYAGGAPPEQTGQERSHSRSRSPVHSQDNHLPRTRPHALQQWKHRSKQLPCSCQPQPVCVQSSRISHVYLVHTVPDIADSCIACKITDPPDLTVRLDGAVHLTHEEHLRALFLPFGDGNPAHGAPPEVVMQEQEVVAPRDFIQALFLILTPNFTPDIAVIPLAAPSSVQEVLSELEGLGERGRSCQAFHMAHSSSTTAGRCLWHTCCRARVD